MVTRLAALGLAAGLGCSSLSGYSTAPGESFCGAATQSGAFRAGLAQGAQMRVTLDAPELDGELSPGAVWTVEPAGRRLLVGASLRRIPALENDALDVADLGGGRDHTRLFALTPGPAGEDPLLAALSLRSDDGIEVRLLRPGLDPASTPAPPPGRQPLFGLFVLYKQAGTCGF